MPAALLTLRLAEPWQSRLRQVLIEHDFEILQADAGQELQALIPRAQIALLHSDPLPQCVDAPALRWIHCGHSGVDKYLPAELFSAGRSITCAAGRSAPALAEHALFMMMQLAYGDNELRVFRRWRQWRSPPVQRRRALHGRTLGIVGMGHSGRHLASYAQALGMRVLGWRRSDQPFPATVEQGYSEAAGDDLTQFLGRCEFLALACTLSDCSRGMFGAEQLEALPRGAFLINIARAGLVDEPALLAALASGRLAGAGLDVHFREPLPVRSPWWTHPKVVMSPHSSPRLASRDQRHFELIEENLRRFQRGDRLHNQLSIDDVSMAVAATPSGTRERLLRRLWNLAYRLALRSANH